jgi:hypothetical protein
MVADLAGLSAAAARQSIEHNITDAGLFAFIEHDLKPHYKLGMLSNAADN